MSYWRVDPLFSFSGIILLFDSSMPLRKTKNKTEKKESSSNKLRVTLPANGSIKKRKEEKELTIDLQRSKDYQWITEQVKRDFQHKKRTPMPQDIKPMLASVTDQAFNDKDWQFEIKWDGYRAMAYIDNGKADIRSRNNLPFAKKYPSVIEALKQWPVNAVVDGEIVILSEEGKADFGALQNWDKVQEGELLYYVFDILWVEGIDLQNEPLSVRRKVLKQLMPDSGLLRFSDCIDECGIDFFAAARANGLEGIIAKQKDAPYRAGYRTDKWFKIKAETRHEAIICGYTKKKDTDRVFSSLVLGIPKNGTWQFIGQVGTGFNRQSQTEILDKLQPLLTTSHPFDKKPVVKDSVQWVKPTLLCEVKYTELTKAGVMRHPSFQGLRDDKTALEINLEEEDEKEGPVKKKRSQKETPNKLTGKKEETSIVNIDGHELKFTNLTKIYWPAEKITKGDVLNYYSEIAPYMLPYMLDRPQSLNRFPNGINGESFYQKDMKGKVDSWLKTFQRFSESNGDSSDFLVCTNEASLLYMANLGCIEMNPWHSRVTSPLYPDWCVIDLDPGTISFDKVIQTARVVYDILRSLSIPSYPKTSGSTGIHIYIPLGAKYNYEQSKQLAELIANLVHAELPDFTSLVRNPQKRKDKIYIDYLQNRPIQTICAPYSLRPKPGATASAPLHWEEVKKGLKMSQFTIQNMVARVKSEGDLFNGAIGKGIDLNLVLKSVVSLI
jgi:bifunctional non-homologous end joining protein LigD